MKNFRVFLSENLQFLEVKLSIYLNRRVFLMSSSFYFCMRRQLFVKALSGLYYPLQSTFVCKDQNNILK